MTDEGVAFDSVSISNTFFDAALTSLLTPVNSCSFSAINPVRISLTNLGLTLPIGTKLPVSYQVNKIKDLIPKDTVENKVNELLKIIERCQKKSYSNAITLILNYTKEHKQLIIYNDPEIPALKLEVRVLEYQVSLFSIL